MISRQQMLNAIDGLIAEAQRLLKKFRGDYQLWTGEFAAWLKASESTVEAIFGVNSDALRSFKAIYFQPPPWDTPTNGIEALKSKYLWFDSGLSYSIQTLVGYRYAIDRLAPDEPKRPTPYVFVSHGGPTMTHVHAVREFLDALGLVGVVVRDQPNLNFSVNEKVRYYMSLCAGAIVLATEEDETTAHELRARPNVENEVGMLQTAVSIGNRIVYLKEPRVQFASNYQEKAWLPFEKERIELAFIGIAKELRAFGFLAPHSA